MKVFSMEKYQKDLLLTGCILFGAGIAIGLGIVWLLP